MNYITLAVEGYKADLSSAKNSRLQRGLLMAFLYKPDAYLSRSTFVLFWLFSVAFVCFAREIFDVSTKFLRHQGVIRHSAFLISETTWLDLKIIFSTVRVVFKKSGAY